MRYVKGVKGGKAPQETSGVDALVGETILCVLRSGCSWRSLPHNFPAWQTVHHYFRLWRQQGVWDQVLDALWMQIRTKQGRDPEPSAAVIDSQSIKTSAVRGPEKGYDMGKKCGAANGTRWLIPGIICSPSKSWRPVARIKKGPKKE